MVRNVVVGAALGIALIVPAAGQSTGQRIVIERPTATARQEGWVRVQASMSIFVPGATDDSEEGTKNRERARRWIYEVAAKECDLLREIMAKDCRLESVQTNMNRQANQQREGYLVNGSTSLQITLK